MTRPHTQRLTASGLLLAVLALPAAADSPPDRDFTFRRITVAPPDSGPRITVQIDPEEQARLLAVRPGAPPQPERPAAAPAPAPGTPRDAMDWFWTAVPPHLPENPGRFVTALAALDTAPEAAGLTPPRMQHLQDIAARHGADILRATIGTQVSPALVLAVIAVESSGRSDAVSSKGATGLMQLIPATAERFGVSDSTDPTQNIRGGVAYLDWLLREFDRDAVLALAAYNAGEGAVRRNGGVPPFAETRAYVPKVLLAWRVARGLCVTPPELPGDGCVFRIASAG